MNDRKSKKEKSALVLNDVMKRKILEICKTSTHLKNIKKKSNKKNRINNSKQTPNTK
ncbi:MAG: hypothetical protein IJJ04_02620 [Clostridia bacterium]|nr:hypothetical protein [Clostridia bacterium]